MFFFSEGCRYHENQCKKSIRFRWPGSCIAARCIEIWASNRQTETKLLLTKCRDNDYTGHHWPRHCGYNCMWVYILLNFSQLRIWVFHSAAHWINNNYDDDSILAKFMDNGPPPPQYYYPPPLPPQQTSRQSSGYDYYDDKS